MNTPELFHINNNIRLLKIATTPQDNETDFYERQALKRAKKVQKLAHKKAFNNPIKSIKNGTK